MSMIMFMFITVIIIQIDQIVLLLIMMRSSRCVHKGEGNIQYLRL